MATNELELVVTSGPELGRRRRFSSNEKRRFLDEAERPGETMSSVGRRYGLSVSLLFRWRRQLQGASVAAAPRPSLASAEHIRLNQKLIDLQRLLKEKIAENDELRRHLRSIPTQAVDEEAKVVTSAVGRPLRDGRA